MVEGQEDVTWDDWCALAAACEEHGVGTLFRSDHYISQGDEFQRRRARRVDDLSPRSRREQRRCGSGRWSPPRRSARLACSRTPSRLQITSPADESSSASAQAGWSASTARSASTSPRRACASSASRSNSRSCTGSGRRSASISAAVTARSRTRPACRKPVQKPRAADCIVGGGGQARHRRARAPLRRRVQHAVRLRSKRRQRSGRRPGRCASPS